MKHYTLFFVLLTNLLFLLPCQVFAQYETYSCGADELPLSTGRSQSSSRSACAFAPVDLADDNILYIRVDMNFFVNDDCSGDPATVYSGWGQEGVFELSKQFINRANDWNEDISGNPQLHQAVNGAQVTSPIDVGIRFVLNEVRIHCDTDFKSSGVSSKYKDYVNSSQAIQVYLVDLSRTTANGFARPGSDYMVIDRAHQQVDAQNFVHEFGHTANLNHTFNSGDPGDDDGCNDTWGKIRQWEYETGKTKGVKGCQQSGNIEFDFGGSQGTQLVCDDGIATSVPATPHPCCGNDHLVNNNIMSYSYKARQPNLACFTECQMDRMEGEIFSDKCSMIADINPTSPPPSAFFGILPSIDLDEACSVDLYLRASMNEAVSRGHRWIYEEIHNGTIYPPSYDSGWGPSSPIKRTLEVSSTNKNVPRGILRHSTTYRITMITKNVDGVEASYAMTFTTADCRPKNITSTPSICCYEVSPNPTSDAPMVSFKVSDKTEISLAVANHSQTTGATLSRQDKYCGNYDEGEYEFKLERGALKRGMNAVILQTADTLIHKNIFLR